MRSARFRSEKGKMISLPDKPLRRGGEGVIYEVPDYPEYLAKIYHEGKRTRERFEKIQVMLKRPPDAHCSKHLAVAWPSELVYDSNGSPVGFLMPYVRNSYPFSLIYHPGDRRKNIRGFTYKHLMRVATNLCIAVETIHRAQHVIGDLNESNILVSPECLVTLVDADSFQIYDPEKQRVYRCAVGKPEYTPPELHTQNVDFSKIDRDEIHDRFALAVLIFMLLMDGHHPYAGVYRGGGEPPKTEERIRQGIFPFSSNFSSEWAPPRPAPPFDLLHPELQELFLRAFVEGNQLREKRPSTKEWKHALENAERDLQECSRSNLHWFPKHYGRCYWCEREQRFPNNGLPRISKKNSI